MNCVCSNDLNRSNLIHEKASNLLLDCMGGNGLCKKRIGKTLGPQ